MYGTHQPMSLGQIPSGIAADVGPVVAGSTQLPSAYYAAQPQQQQYAANSGSVTSARRMSLSNSVDQEMSGRRMGLENV